MSRSLNLKGITITDTTLDASNLTKVVVPSSNDNDSAVRVDNFNTELNLKAPINNPTFTGTVNAPTVAVSNNSTNIATTAYVKAVVGDLINSAPGTLDTLKEIADALGNDPNLSGTLTTEIALKAPLESPAFTGTVSGITKTMVGLNNVDNTSDVNKPISITQQSALDTKAPLESPTFTGTVSGITKTMVGLSNVDNTTDLDKPISNATQTALDLKAPLESPTFTGTVTGITETMVGLSNVDNTSDVNKPISTAQQSALNLKAPLESPAFTGTVSGITKTMIGLNNVDNTSDVNKPISIAQQSALDTKAPLESPTFTGTVSAPTVASSNNSTNVATTAYVKAVVGDLINSAPGTLDTLKEIADALGNDPNLSGTLTTEIALKAPLESPTFTGTVSGITKTMVGLSNVDNTSDINKPISNATQTALDTKAPLESPAFTGTVTGITKTMVGLNNVDNTSDVNKPVSNATQTALDLKAPLESPTFTGTVSGITKIMVGLGNVDNTTDLDKPVSNAQQTALDTKAPLESPAFTGTVTGITKTMVDLNNVDNTSDVNKPISIAQQTALDTKAPLESPTFTGTVSGITKIMVGLGNVDNTSDVNKPISSVTQTALDTKAPLESPAFTGTVTGITKTMVDLNNVDNTSDVNKPISIAQQTALDTKAPLESPAFTGTVTGITKNMVGLSNVDNTSDVNKPISSVTQTALDTKAPLESPTFTGTVTGITKIMVGLGNVDNTSDVNKPISSVTQTALDTKAPLESPTFTGTVTGITKTMVGLSNVDNTTDLDKPISNATQTALDTKAPLESPTFTGTVTGITKTMVGLSNVDNTSDINKPISNATQTALDLKAPLESPTFTGTVTGITKTMVGLSNVDNTSDVNKPISNATQIALDTKAPLESPTFTGTVSAPTVAVSNNSTNVATTAYVKAVVGDLINSAPTTLDTLKEIADALGNDPNLSGTLTTSIGLKAPLESPAFTGTVSGITKSMINLGNVDNTSDANKPISTAQQSALDTKAPLESPAFTGTVSGITKSMVGLGNVDNISDTNKPISTAQQTALDLKAPINNPTFTGTVSAPTVASSNNSTHVATTAYVKAVIGDLIDSAPETLDTLKEIADSLGNDPDLSGTLTAAIALKAPIESPTFTGTVSGIDKTMVGLENVDNTSDADKPVSTAQQSELDLKAPLESPSFTGDVTVTSYLQTPYVKYTNGISSDGDINIEYSAAQIQSGFIERTISSASTDTFNTSELSSWLNNINDTFILTVNNNSSYNITFSTSGSGVISFIGNNLVLNSWKSGTFLIVCTGNNSWTIYQTGGRDLTNMLEGYNQLSFPAGVNSSINLIYLIDNKLVIDGDSSNYYVFQSDSNTTLTTNNFKDIYATTSYSQINVLNNTTLNVTGDAYFNMLPNAVFSTINVEAGSTLIASALQLNGITVIGSGTVSIVALNDTPSANLSNVSTSTTNITMSADTTFTSGSRMPSVSSSLSGSYKLILGSSTNISYPVSIASGVTIEAIGTYLTGKTISGVGNVTITQMASNTNLTNISVSGTKIARFIDNITYSASLYGWNVVVNASKTLNIAAVYITDVVATGSGTINISALNATLGALLHNITISTVNVSMNADAVLTSSARLPGVASTLSGSYKLTLANVNNISHTVTVSSGTTVEGAAAYLTSKTLNGAGTVNVVALNNTLDALLNSISTTTVNVSMNTDTILTSSARLPISVLTLSGSYKLTVSHASTIANTITVSSGTTVEGLTAYLTTKTLNGSGTVNALTLNATLDALLNNITTSNINVTMSADTILNSSARLPGAASTLNGAYKLTLSNASNIVNTITVSSSSTIEGVAAYLTNKTLNGSGTVNILALNDTLNAILNNITSSNINITMNSDTVLDASARLPGSASILNGAYKLTLLHINNIVSAITVSSTSIVESVAAYITTKTLNGSGTVNILELNNTLGAVLNNITTSTINVSMNANAILTSSARLPGAHSTLDGAYKLTVSDVSNIASSITVASGPTVEGAASTLTGKTLNGAGTVNILALNATLGALLDNITTSTINVSMNANAILTSSARLPGAHSTLDGAYKLTVSDVSNIVSSITVASGTTVEGNASTVTGKTLNGAGTVNVLALNATLGALLDNITTSTITVSMSADSILTSSARLPGAHSTLNGSHKLTISDVNNIVSSITIVSGTSVEGTAAHLTGKTLDGTGIVNILELDNKLDALLNNITTSTINVSMGADAILTSSARLPGALSTLDGAYKLTVSSVNNIINTITVSSGTTVEGTAAHLTGKTLDGAGTVNVLALNATLSAILNNITTSVINVTLNSNATLNSSARLPGAPSTLDGSHKLTVSDASTISNTVTVSSETTLEGLTAYLTGKTINGLGTVNSLVLNGTLDALLDNITTSTVNVTMSANAILTSNARLSSVPMTLNGAYKLTVSDVNNILNTITVASGTTVEGNASTVTGKTLNGLGTVNVLALNDTLDALLNNITTSNINVTISADTVLTSSARLPGASSTLNGAFKLTVSDISNISHNINVTSGTVEGTAAYLSSKTLNGFGTVNILALNDKLDALLNNITTSNINVTMSADTVLDTNARLPGSASVLQGLFKLTLSNVNNISHTITVSTGTTVESVAAYLTGKTLNGSGTVNVLELNATLSAVLNNITASNINVTIDANTVLTSSARLPGALSNINGAYKLTISDINNISNSIVLSSEITVEGQAVYLTSKTLSGTGTVNILSLNNTLDALLNNITASNINVTIDANTTLNSSARLPGASSVLNGAFKLTVSNVNNIVSTITISSGTTVEGFAAYLTGKTLDGAGTVNVLQLNNTLDALLNNITATNINVYMTGDAILTSSARLPGSVSNLYGLYKLTVNTFNNISHEVILGSGSTLEGSSANLSNKTISGSGVVIVTDEISSGQNFDNFPYTTFILGGTADTGMPEIFLIKGDLSITASVATGKNISADEFMVVTIVDAITGVQTFGNLPDGTIFNLGGIANNEMPNVFTTNDVMSIKASVANGKSILGSGAITITTATIAGEDFTNVPDNTTFNLGGVMTSGTPNIFITNGNLSITATSASDKTITGSGTITISSAISAGQTFGNLPNGTIFNNGGGTSSISFNGTMPSTFVLYGSLYVTSTIATGKTITGTGDIYIFPNTNINADFSNITINSVTYIIGTSITFTGKLKNLSSSIYLSVLVSKTFTVSENSSHEIVSYDDTNNPLAGVTINKNGTGTLTIENTNSGDRTISNASSNDPYFTDISLSNRLGLSNDTIFTAHKQNGTINILN